MKFEILKKCGDQVVWWYIKKFNPFTMEKMAVAGVEGFLVRLPMTKKDALEDQEKTEDVVGRTLESLRDFRVDMVLPPDEYPYPFLPPMPVATGRGLFPFFMPRSVGKALHMTGKDIKTAELLILGGGNGVTEHLVDQLYPHVNYLTVLVNNRQEALEYEKKAEEIFYDVGLTLQVTEKNKTVLENADVVINAGSGMRFDYYYKRGGVYFDVGGSRGDFMELMGKRPDILAVDGLRVSCLGVPVDFRVFELAFYSVSLDYRTLLTRGYRRENAILAMNTLLRMDVRLQSLCRLSKPAPVPRWKNHVNAQ